MTIKATSKGIGKNLQATRKSAGFKSAKAFAESVGMSASAYTEYEQGRRSFTYEQAWQFADALGCTLDEVGGRTPPPREYDDPRQKQLNDCYEAMNESGRALLAESAKSISADPARRGE